MSIDWLDKKKNKTCSVDGLDPGEYVQAPLLWSPVGRENVHNHIIAN
ncbi:hypothetical protein LMF89_03810 [Pelosinus sp. Bkl1]|uniref:Uncharacterized protein n=1 Tax=Pelosinus baikalensis TaxID=2892015 RepID=A0ABS8HPJ0_9FIRM|nr:hypothetical protein [Pelosinus baikalensis]